MKTTYIIASGLLIIGIGYFGNEAVTDHIDHASGYIVESTLADNTIQQLETLAGIKESLDGGNLEVAQGKLSEAVATLEYILKSNCSLPQCKEALRSYETE